MAPRRSRPVEESCPVAVEPATAGADDMEACGGLGNKGGMDNEGMDDKGMDNEGSAKESCEHKKLWAKSSIFQYLS